MFAKVRELVQEFQTVFSGRNHTMDTIIPPLIFTVVNMWMGLYPAAFLASALALVLTVMRLFQKQSWAYALSGVVFTLLAVVLAWYTQNAASFFLPAMMTSGCLLLAALFSIWMGKPLAAWSSHLTRAWPREWYWHPRVNPAYMEVTWLWALFIALRLLAQYMLYQNRDAILSGWGNIWLDWPVTIIMLVVSYLYGTWRLAKLAGPSVEEFSSGTPPPWKGQKRGF